MKKALTVFATAGLTVAGISAAHAQTVLDDVTVDAIFGFESEYSFRGVKLDGPSFQPGLEIGIMDGYAGVWSSMPLDRRPQSGNEIDFYGGWVFPVADAVQIDVGYTYYWYPQDVDHGHDSEPYVGVVLPEVLFEPSLYLFYEHKEKVFTVEASAGYGFDLDPHGIANTSLQFGVYAGYVFFDDDAAEDYLYYGLTADLVYTVNDAVAISAGARFAGNNENMEPDRQLWWGTAVAISY